MQKSISLNKLISKIIILILAVSLFVPSVAFADNPYGDGSKNTKVFNSGGYGSSITWNTSSGSQTITTGTSGGGNLGVNIAKFKAGWGSIASQFVSTSPETDFYEAYNVAPLPNPNGYYYTKTFNYSIPSSVSASEPYIISFSTYGDEEEAIGFGNIRITISGVEYTPQGAINAGLIEPMFLIMTTGSTNLSNILSGSTTTVGTSGAQSVVAVAFITKPDKLPSKVSWWSEAEWLHIAGWKTAKGAPSVTPVSQKYNIRFNGNGSTSGSMPNMTDLDYSTEYTLPVSQFKKTGYWQSGWAKTATGELAYSNEATISKLLSTDGSTVGLYAKWEPKLYSIRFNANNGTGLTKLQDLLYYDQTYTLLPNEFTKEGYHFAGWSVDSPNNEVTYADKARFTNLYSETGIKELFAHWEANDYTATISGDRGVASTSGSGTHKADSTFTINGTLKPGFSFKDWTGETTETSQEATVKMPLHDAAWTMNTEPIIYDINYEMNDGYNNEDNPSEFTVVSDPLTILDPHKAHYDFVGWTGAPGETPVIEPVIQTGTLGDQTFVANWTPTVYPVTYDLGDPEAQNHPANPDAYTIEDDTITLQDPTWPGYDFFGWKEGNTISAGSSGAKHFTAQWDPSEDELVYDANGGKGTMSPDSGTQGDYVSVKENEFTRKGYTFLGWNTKADGTGKSYKANDYYLLSYQDPNTDILYAQWKLEIYPITYVLNGATNHSENPEEYDADHSYLIQPATKKGHNFLGWEEGDMIIKGSTGPKTFTANLVPYKYTITFNGNEADSGEMPNQEFVYDVKSALNENQFSRIGYNFLGWATEADSEEVAYQDGEEILNLSEEDGDEIELFAVWKKIVKPYTYKPCDGPVQFEPETYMVPFGDEIPPYSGGDISNDDYTFEGWTDVEDEDGNISRCPVFREIPKHTITFKYNFTGSPEDVVKVYNEGTPITIIGVPERAGYNFLYWKGSEYQPGDTYTVVEDHTFTAQWEIINYDIKYDLPSDATNNSKNPYSYNIETGVQVQDPIRPGYKFLGWQEGDTIPVGSTGEKTFTAQWELLTYNISYITGPCENHPDNPSTYNVTDSITLKVPACEGYTVDGWDPSNEIPEGSSGDKTFTLIYTPVDYNISYSLNGGENHADNPKSYTIASPTITLKDPSRHGYDFVKWSPEGRIPAGSTGDKAFSAGWIAKYYNVTYILPEGAENNPANPEKYTIEEEYNILPPVYSGHKFLGWKEGNKIPAGSTGDKTFTAEFDVIGYNIAFDCQPGSGEMATIKAQLHTNVKLPKSTCACKGHVFTGWEYDGKVYKDESEVKDLIDRDGATVTLKAIYEIEHFNITYDLGVGGVNDPSNPNSYTVNDEVILKPATRKGYEFISWSPSGKIEKGTTGAIKFTANWKAISYAIEYNLDGGTNNPQNPSSYTIESGDIILKDPTKAGCTFKGWSPSNKISSSALAKVTVTAQWDCSVPSNAPAAVNTGYGDNLIIQSFIATISSLSAAMIAILKKKKEEE